MKKVLSLLIVSAVIFTSSFSFSNEIKTTKKVLKNGLTVLVSELPSSPFASIYVMVKTGSVTEGKYLGSGITHFVEHMLFKGTEKRGVGVIPEQIRGAGGVLNASTGKDHTLYSFTVPYEEFDMALDTISDMMLNPLMDAQEMEKERKVIIAEMKMHQDNPDRALSKLAFENVFKFHPYRYEIIGEVDLFRKISNEELLDYYQTHYAPNNMILSIAGNVNTSEVMEKSEKAFESFKRQRYLPRNLVQEPEQISERREEGYYPMTHARLSVAYRGVRLLDEDLYALDVLSIILGSGQSSYLYKKLYDEKKIVYSIRSLNYTPVDTGAFEIESVLEGENVESAIKEILKVIEGVKKKGVTKKEVEKAKRQVLKQYIFERQTSDQLAGVNAYDEAFAGDYQFSKQYVSGINKVNAVDVLRVAREYLVANRRSTTILWPKVEEDEELKDKAETNIPQIKKTVLKNGVTVLIRQDETFDVVTLRAAFNGGLRQESEENLGITKLMAALLTEGNKSLKAEEIDEFTEELGIEYSSFSGRNSFGVSMRFLPQDISEAFDLFKDSILNPVFPDKELSKIKKSVKASIKAKKDSIYRFADQALREELFSDNSFKYDGLGTEETVDSISRKNIEKFYERFLVGENLVIVAFGNVDEDVLLAKLEKEFSKIKKGTADLKYTEESPLTNAKSLQLELDKNQAIVMFGFHGPKIDHEDRYSVEVLTEVLGSSFNGRLFTVVREELGKAYTLGGNYLPSRDAGYISLYVKTSEDSVEKVKELVTREINDLIENEMEKDELDVMKNHLKGVHKRSFETNHALSFVSMLDELYGFGYDYYKKYDEKVNAVGTKEIQNMATKYMKSDEMAVVTVVPKKDSEK